MQMRAFRGSRTVMSLRLSFRARWTTSATAAIENAIVTAERTFVQVPRCNLRFPGKTVAGEGHRPARRRRDDRRGLDHRHRPGPVEAAAPPRPALLRRDHRG